ncbi:hypothetical protein Bca101_015731 [Brassica carinata]
MAEKGVRVLTTPTSDLVKILACIHEGLRGCWEKVQKDSVSLDIVNFGEDDDEEKPQKLETLLSAVNNNDGIHIVHVPYGANALSDVLLSTPVFTGDDGASGYVSAAAAAGGDFDFGVDPNIDPELALALRVSMEEERARQEAAAKKTADEAGEKDQDGATASASQETVARTTEKNAEPMDEDNALLNQAIAMSVGDVNMSEAADEDQDLALGVDPNDPAVQALLASLPDESKRNEEEENSSKGEDEKK